MLLFLAEPMNVPHHGVPQVLWWLDAKVSTNTLGGSQSPMAPLEVDTSPIGSFIAVVVGIVGFVDVMFQHY